MNNFLERETLFADLVEEIQKKVVGETNSIATILLCCCGIWVKNNSTASFNLMVNSSSGSGKDYIIKKVLEILPQNFWIKRTRISPTAFNYWHSSRLEPEWCWDGKILYLEDVSENILNHDVMKVMVSTGSHATIVIKQQAIDLEIKGKPVTLITSASASPNNEMLRRFPILNLDETAEQTKRIKEKQAELAERGSDVEYNGAITHALEGLERVNVTIPYAKKIIDLFPDNLIVRTALDRFFDYVRASCALHQRIRERDSKGFYIATPQDYNIARIALLKTTTNQFLIPTTKAQREILDVLKEEPNSWFTIKELSIKVKTVGERQLYTLCNKLFSSGLIRKDSRREEGRKDEFIFSFANTDEISLPTWDEKNF